MNHHFCHYYISTTHLPRNNTIEYCNLAFAVGCRAFHIEIYSEGGEPSLNKPDFISTNEAPLPDLLSLMRDKAFEVSKVLDMATRKLPPVELIEYAACQLARAVIVSNGMNTPQSPH